jgi:hypothetical protein
MQHSHSHPPSGAGVRSGPVLARGDNRKIEQEGRHLVEEGNRPDYMGRGERRGPV